VIAQATLRLDTSGEQGAIQWDPVVFSYGPVKGRRVSICRKLRAQNRVCEPKFTVQFGALDAAACRRGSGRATEQGTLLSELIARFAGVAPVWPALRGRAGGFADSWAGDAGAAVGDAEDPEHGSGNQPGLNAEIAGCRCMVGHAAYRE